MEERRGFLDSCIDGEAFHQKPMDSNLRCFVSSGRCVLVQYFVLSEAVDKTPEQVLQQRFGMPNTEGMLKILCQPR
jgi:pyridoxine/pyridoxamine 5'-phosphate oxidase